MKAPEFFKKSKKLMITAAALTALAACAFGVTAATADPGSDSDPIVTKSYVDSAIANALGSGTPSVSGDASYEVVFAEAGQKIIATGSTEMILRSGSALTVAPGSDGVSDMTRGIDMKNNYTVYANHLMLIPRDAGRGIRMQTDGYVMVRGSYEIQ